MSDISLWVTIAIIGGATFLLRLSLIQLQDRVRLPTRWQQALRYVPAAVLAALVVPALIRPEGFIDLSWGNERLIAGALAAAVAWWSGNVLLTMAVGMGTLWLLLRLGG
jgi:branched-subunit amino acid transport protein